MIYEVQITGVLKYAKLVTVEDKETGDPMEVNDTAGVEFTRTYEAESHAEAKEKFKKGISQLVADRGAIGFDGTVDAWTVTKNQLLDDVPFSVEVQVNEEILVDF